MRESLRRLASDENMDGSRRGTGKCRRVQVELLDGNLLDVDIERKARGGELLDKICDKLDILEKDYFGMLFEDRGDQRTWVNLGKRLSKTFKNGLWDVRLAVKFYPPEPILLQHDNTRYHLTLAIRRDILEGRLSCSNITYALLASYILQAELGDLEESEVANIIVGDYNAAPPGVLDQGMIDNILELYNSHRGQTPAECELNYLENAKKLPLYGMEMHPARDSEDVDIVLGVSGSGISVYRDTVLMNRFPWAKILKIRYNKRVYSLTLRAGECDAVQSEVGFRLPSSRASHKLWTSSVEQHMFFRRETPVEVDRVPGWKRLGSKRLSCRQTLSQLRAIS